MQQLKEILAKINRTPGDVLGVELDGSGARAVRARRLKTGGVVIQAIESIADLPSPENSMPPGKNKPLFPLSPQLNARYVSIAVSSPNNVVKLLSFPGQFTDENAEHIIVGMGLRNHEEYRGIGFGNPEEYRIGYRVVAEGHARAESRVLAAGVMEEDAAAALAFFAAGLPAPYSIEPYETAVLTAFTQSMSGDLSASNAVALLDFGEKNSFLSIFTDGVPALLRRFDFGTLHMLDRICSMLGVDSSTARNILHQSSFDLSSVANEMLGPVIHQIIISRDFVERRDNCRLAKMYVSGELATSHDITGTITGALDISLPLWQPFEKFEMEENAVAPEQRNQLWRFAAALGASLASLEKA